MTKQIAFYPPGGGEPVYAGEHMADYYASIGWKRGDAAAEKKTESKATKAKPSDKASAD